MSSRATWTVIHFALGIAILILGARPAWADDFKITIPSYWQKVSVEIPGDAYFNTHSKQNQMILARVIPFGNGTHAKPEELAAAEKILIQDRADQLRRIGITGYSANLFKISRSRAPNAPAILTIEARYTGVRRQEVQLVERNYFVRNKIYQIIYTEESPGLGNRQRIAALLDAVRPQAPSGARSAVWQYFEETLFETSFADETKNGAASSTTPSSGSSSEAPVPVPQDKAMTPEEAKQCESVVKDPNLRRTQDDPGFWAASGKTMGNGCLKGLKGTASGLASSAWGFVKDWSGPGIAYREYKYLTGTEEYKAASRAEGAAALEVAKHPIDSINNSVKSLADYVKTQVTEFPCLKPKQQWGIVCRVAAEGGLAIAGGVRAGMAIKGALDTRKAAKLAELADKAAKAELAGAASKTAAQAEAGAGAKAGQAAGKAEGAGANASETANGAKTAESSGSARPPMTAEEEAADRALTHEKAVKAIGAEKAEKYREEIYNAHRIGDDAAVGKDGVNAPGRNNYTEKQIAEKARSLRNNSGGELTKADRDALIRSGTVGRENGGAEWLMKGGPGAETSELVVEGAKKLETLGDYSRAAETAKTTGKIAEAESHYAEVGERYMKSNQFQNAREALSMAPRTDSYAKLVSTPNSAQAEWRRLQAIEKKAPPATGLKQYYYEQLAARRAKQVILERESVHQAVLGTTSDEALATINMRLDAEIEDLTAKMQRAQP